MTTANHASAGTQSYSYHHANQRAQTSRCGSVRNGNTVADDPEGLGGERLMEFQETCTGGACTSYTETQRWIDAAGRKMFQKTGTTLKAITPNRLASEAKHFPYGETDGTPPADTKDYFATYRRDGTGLDYAWNRYYSPTMGRFTTADPGPYSYFDPSRMNLYTYSGNNPVNLYDPTGRSWDDFWGAIVGFFGGGSDSGENSSSAAIGNGNDVAVPAEGVVGAEGAGGAGGTATTATIQYDDGSSNTFDQSNWDSGPFLSDGTMSEYSVSALQAISQAFRPVSVLNIHLCNGGDFVYAGVIQGHSGAGPSVHYEVLVVVDRQQHSGNISIGVIGEGGVGPSSGGGEVAVDLEDGSVHTSGLAFGQHEWNHAGYAGVSAGVLAGTDGTVGFFGGIDNVGIGTYGTPTAGQCP